MVVVVVVVAGAVWETGKESESGDWGFSRLEKSTEEAGGGM